MRQSLLILLVLLGGLVFGDDTDRFALVIGNASYDGEARLTNPANDASDVSEALTAIGWKVTKLIDGDRKAMNKVIHEFHDALTASSSPTALLFYAGHGVQISGQNYLIPVGEIIETPNDVTDNAVALQSILDSFDDARASTDIVILDACRDNPFTKKNSRSIGESRGLSVVNKGSRAEGSVVMFATAPGETALDGEGRNGVFTQALLKYIASPLKIQDVATKVTGEVRTLTGGKQVPYNSISLSDDFYLVPATFRDEVPLQPVSSPVETAKDSTKVAPDKVALKAGLIVQKDDLVGKKKEVESKASWVNWLAWGGLSACAVGAGVAGYGYYAGGQALNAYNSAVTANDYTSARQQANTANTVYEVGLGVGVVGLIAGVSSLFLTPDTKTLDAQIQDVQHQLTLLGGN